jgi:hypothetical protein
MRMTMSCIPNNTKLPIIVLELNNQECMLKS